MKLADIVKKAVVVKSGISFKDVLRIMVEEQTNNVLVVDDSGALCGEVSVSNLMKTIVPKYLNGDSIAAGFANEDMFLEYIKENANKPVESFMLCDPDTIREDDGIMAVASATVGKGRYRVPVVDENNRPIGIISRRGIKQIIARCLGVSDLE